MYIKSQSFDIFNDILTWAVYKGSCATFTVRFPIGCIEATNKFL